MDGTGSGSCPMTGFGINGVEPLGFCCQRVSELDGSREVGCEDGSWMELA